MKFSTSNPGPAYVPALDGVRAFAILGVLLYHFVFWNTPSPTGAVSHLLWTIAREGWIGVDVFFVLSGYLITTGLRARRGTADYFSRFYARRARRILPPYALTLVATLALMPGSGPFVALSSVFLSNIADLVGIRDTYPFLWSISVEEHFYLIWPWLVYVLSGRRLAGLCVFLILGEPLLRAARLHFGWAEGFYTWFWVDSLAGGALLALVLERHPEDPTHLRRIRRACVIGGMVLVGGGILGGGFSRRGFFGAMFLPTTIAVFSAAFVAYARSLGARFNHWLAAAPLRYVGKISYGIYLYHGFVLDRIFDAPWLPHGNLGALLLTFGLGAGSSFALAHFSFRYFEGPILYGRRSRFGTLQPTNP